MTLLIFYQDDLLQKHKIQNANILLHLKKANYTIAEGAN